MPNPIWSWLRGDDLKAKVAPETEQKLFFYEDVGAAIRLGTLVHGPGATELIDRAAGYGGDGNSAVFACLSAICTAFPEAPLRVWQGTTDSNELEPIADHQVELLLERPNPHMAGPVLWSWVQWVKHIDGNAYWRKIRSGDPEKGNVVQLWPISPLRIKPITEKGSLNFIDYYKYQYAPGKYENISTDNIVHFRLGLDDRDHRLGMSPLKRLVREVAGDEEASRWQTAMLTNGGAAGMVVQVPKETTMSPEEAMALKARIGAAYGNDKRGSVGVLTGGATMVPYGYNPKDMDMKALHRVPEERIAAVLRVPAIIAGLGAGLDRSTYANFREAREMFAEQTIMPLYAQDAATLNLQLMPDFTPDRRIVAGFDTSNLRALQEDRNQLFTRLNGAVAGGWIVPNEARAEVGLPPIPGGEIPRARPGSIAAPPTKAGRVLEIKGEDFDQFPELFQAMIDLAEPGFERAMDRYLDGQRKRVKRALTSGS